MRQESRALIGDESPAAPRTLLALRVYTHGEFTANWVTHGVGIGLSVVGLALLVLAASRRGDAWHLASFTVFGLALILLYTASTVYHLARSERWRGFFQKVDHAAIFLLIAGTYTPLLLTSLRGPWGWPLFGVIWALCGSGAVLQFLPGEPLPWMKSTRIYLAAGWLIVVALVPLVSKFPMGGLLLLLAGGLCYTSGVVFYRWHRLPYHHAIWHLFVLGGSACHFFAVLLFTLPKTM